MYALLLVAMTAAPDLSKLLTLELHEAPAEKFFDMISEAVHAPVRLNAPLAGKKVSLKLRNAPVSNVLDLVTPKLGVRYRLDDGALVIEPLAAPAAGVAAVAPPAAGSCNPADVERLRTRVNELEALVLSLRKDQQAVAGVPVTWPGDVPERLRDANQLQRAFVAAFREAGFARADVTSVDCAEFPCIVNGHGFGGPEDMPKLQKTAAFEAYAGDSHFVWGWRHSKDAGSDDRTFAVGMLPKGYEMKQHPDVRKRLEARVRAMHESED